MKRVMTAVLAVLLLAMISIGGVLPVYAEAAHVHTAYEEAGVGASLPEAIGPDPSGYDQSMSVPPLNAKPIGSYGEFRSMEPGKSYYLTADITVVATYPQTFTGSLYGNGHTITTNVPLFTSVNRATITDLVIKGDISYSSAVGAVACTAVAPQLYRVINYANVRTTAAESNAGGFFGSINKSDFNVTFAYCENHGDITGSSEAGGFVGYMQGTYDEADDAKKTSHLELLHCLNTGHIVSGKEAGGLIGQPGGGGSNYEWLYTITMTNCANTGVIESTGGSVGGLLGEAHAGLFYIDSCYNTANCTSTSDIAGIVARIVHRASDSAAVVTNCYNTGNMVGTGDIAGIVGEGRNDDAKALNLTFRIENCYNSGSMTGNRTGGILGTAGEGQAIHKIYIKNCTNDGRIESTTNYGGGISARADVRAVNSTVAGFRDETVVYENCVNNGETIAFQSQTGGMVGYSQLTGSGDGYGMAFYNCVNTGYVHSTDLNKDVHIGGMAGQVQCDVSFYNCVNTGKIHSGGNAGGMGGYLYRTITAVSCVSLGDITGGRHLGGIVGRTVDTAISGVDQDDHYFYGNLVVGDITDCDYRATTHAKGIGGLAGLLYGDATAENNAILSNMKGVYSERNEDGAISTKEKGFVVSAIFGGQVGDAAFVVRNNYFAGSLDSGTLGKKVMVTNAPGSQKLGTSSDASTGNYTIAAGLPLYYNGIFPASTFFTQIVDAVNSEAFVATLNSTAGANAFTLVTTCEGDTYVVATETAKEAFALTRGHNDPSYNYYTKQMSDGECHWMACAVCGAADASSVEEHKAADGAKATCKTKTVCVDCGNAFGELDPENHEGTVNWTCTPTTHSATSSCCGEIAEEAHGFENGVCTECGYTCLHDGSCGKGAVCTLCGETYDGNGNHVWSTTEWVAVDAEDKHYRPCENCDAYDPTSGVACSVAKYPADCLNLAVCKDCEQTYGDVDPDNHAHPGSFYYDPYEDKCATKYTCCDSVYELVDHVEETPADCLHRAVCANCGWIYGEEDLTNHVSDEVIYRVSETDPTKHEKIYTCCDHMEIEEHTGGTADCVTAAKCSACNAYYGEANTDHAFDHKCDATCNVCGELRSPEAHAFGGWLVTVDPTETTAGSQMRACVVCGAVQNATIAPITNLDNAILDMPEVEEQSDAYIGVIVIAAAAALVVGLIVAFIVSKKKKAK